MASFIQWAKWLGGLVLLVIGLAGVPEDIEVWQKWISALHGMDWFTDSVLRWTLFSIGASLLLWVNYPTIKSRFAGKAREDVSSQLSILKIKYTDEAANRRYMRFEGNRGPCTWYLEILNESINTDAQEVEIKVESCDQIPDLLSPHARTAAFTHIGIPLTFERGGQTRTIRRQDSEWVKFLSFDRQIPRRWIQIGEYGEGRLDLHGKIVSVYTPHRIEVTVRAANASPVTAHYVVKAENEMLQVQKL
jgi:hypothetical protein